MKKMCSLFILIILFSGCCGIVYNYNVKVCYEEYISDCNNGYDDVPYYCVEDSMINSDKAQEYYKYNNRRIGDFLITDYLNGVCVNRYFGDSSYKTISIPESIDGKPVVKIGTYLEGEKVIGAFGGNTLVNIELPSSVKVISSVAIMSARWMIPEDSRDEYVDISGFTVDENNNYYATDNGSLYTKDFKTLLWLNDSNQKIVVPEYVETFEPSNGVYDLLKSITIGKNVKKINTFIDKGESGTEPDKNYTPEVVIKGYKNTEAEKWAKKQYAKFKSLD
jgi:hypothetical protein